MKIYPAIDLRGGNVVRLVRGDYDRMSVYGDKPGDTALWLRDMGARQLHVVDLDGAKSGNTDNIDVIADIIKEI